MKQLDKTDNKQSPMPDKRTYVTPKLEELGRVAALTLGGASGVSEAGSEDENESFP